MELSKRKTTLRKICLTKQNERYYLTTRLPFNAAFKLNDQTNHDRQFVVKL